MSANRGVNIVIHSLEKSRAQRVIWLMEELNLSYEIQTYKRGANGVAPPEMKQIHPLGKSPILSISAPDAQPLDLAESSAIFEYLLDHFQGANLIPKRYIDGKEGQPGGETESWLRYRYYMHYTEGSFTPVVVTQLLMNTIKEGPAPFFLKPITNMVPHTVEKEYCKPNFETHFGFLEDQLATSPDRGKYFCGSQFTAVDILLSYPLIVALCIGVLNKEKYPLICAYLDHVRTFEGYKQSVKKLEEVEGQPYSPL
ncbi:hypothetical protein BBP40_008439 [Aspergillus hancockii]|nr:hypothetical protein BBP40_008439 [Aspergillus hancockii]